MQFAQQAAPDLVKCSSAIADATTALSGLTSALSPVLSELSCPQLTAIDESQFSQFPGYAKLNCVTGTY